MGVNLRFTQIHLAFLALFGGSALLSLLYATDMRVAALQVGGVVLAIGLHGLFWLHRDRAYLRWVLALLPLALALGALLMVDWQTRLGRYTWLDGVLQWLLLARSINQGSQWDTHAIGGILAILLPLQWHALAVSPKPASAATSLHHVPFQRPTEMKPWPLLPRVCALVLCGITVSVALLSGSKAIWAALLISAISHIALSLRLPNRGPINPIITFVQRFWLMGALLAVLAFVAWLLSQTNQTNIATSNGARIAVWQNSLSLVRDFAFTGVGFGNYPMAFSSYVLLVHVPFLEHAYNLWLNLWLNQGLLGLLAWLGLLVTALVSNQRNPQGFWHAPALAAFSTILLYGLFDDPFYGYGGAMLPLLLLPSALLAPALSPRPVHALKISPRQTLLSVSRLLISSIATAGAAVIAVAFVATAIPSLRASWHANAGALMQMKTELSLYRWPDFAVQDQLRISPQVNLDSAINEYQQAIQLDPANATANQHLGQIELARSEWAPAFGHLNTAWASDPTRRATRQMLGELCLIAGNDAMGLDLWRTLDVQQGQLDIREAWYRYILKTDQVANRLATAVQLIEKR